MTLKVHPIIYYRSKNDAWTEKWQPNDWAALNIVRAIKNKPITRSSRVELKSGRTLVVDGSADGRRRTLSVLCASVAARIEKAGYETAIVVPIPASNHTDPSKSFTGSRLALQIEASNASLVASPTLYFSEEVPKSSNGGGRDAGLIKAKLRGGDEIARGSKVILLDDVLTTGAHMKAAARYLRGKGVIVNDAFVIARTVWDRPEHMLRATPEDLVF